MSMTLWMPATVLWPKHRGWIINASSTIAVLPAAVEIFDELAKDQSGKYILSKVKVEEVKILSEFKF